MYSNSQSRFIATKKRNNEMSIDLSRKGAVDEPIQHLISFINSLEEFVTTSSCSGRIIVVSKDGDCTKKGCKWITTNHAAVDPEIILQEIRNCNEKNMVLKFEPFILHVQCKDLSSAKKMQNCALAAGFRNSGSIFGRNGSLTLAVRGTHGMEVPLSDEFGILVTDEYIKFILKKANIKMEENERKIKQFSRAVYEITSSELKLNKFQTDVT